MFLDSPINCLQNDILQGTENKPQAEFVFVEAIPEITKRSRQNNK